MAAVLESASGDGTLERMDYDEREWSADRLTELRPRVFGVWRGVTPEADAPNALAVDVDGLSELLEHLAASDDPKRQAFGYLVSLILLRKRRLVAEHVDPTCVRVRPRGSPPPPEGPEAMEFTVEGLDAETIASVREQLAVVLPGLDDGPGQPG